MIFYTCGWWNIATTPANGAFQLSLLIPLMPFVAKRTVIGPVWSSSWRKCRETHCYTKRHFADATLGSGARKSTCILGHVQVNGWTAEAITLETRFFYCGYSAKQKVFSVLTDLSLHSFERMPIGTADHMCTTFYLRAHSHSLFLSDTRTVHLSRRSQVLERGCLGLNSILVFLLSEEWKLWISFARRSKSIVSANVRMRFLIQRPLCLSIYPDLFYARG